MSRRVCAVLAALALGLPACDGGGADAPADPAACEVPRAASSRPDPARLDERPLPGWFDDAKFGIMIHWGLYSVPAWAETRLDPGEWLFDPLLQVFFGSVWYAHNPYSEWYFNTYRIPGSPAALHHAETYGADVPYESFQETFERESAGWRADDWATLFRRAGARYVVMVTKHHDGFALWPSAASHPTRADGWHTSRDYVGELARASRSACLRFGAYYSGGLDWSIEAGPISGLGSFLGSWLDAPAALDFVDAQWRELIARYSPSVLWNDIDYALGAAPLELMADYYAAVEEGVVNDRWGPFPGSIHHDFSTPEYRTKPDISPTKFESVRGLGRSFGYNTAETDADRLSPAELVRFVVDVVSKNGNVLINVGPRADGSIPTEQSDRLLALGDWLAVHGDAIHGTRPWSRAEVATTDGTPARFTWRAERRTLYVTFLAALTPGAELRLPLEPGERPARVRWLGANHEVPFSIEPSGSTLVVAAPAGAGDDLAPTLALALPESP